MQVLWILEESALYKNLNEKLIFMMCDKRYSNIDAISLHFVGRVCYIDQRLKTRRVIIYAFPGTVSDRKNSCACESMSFSPSYYSDCRPHGLFKALHRP